MSVNELDTVVLERDLPTYGLCRGDVGAVVQVLNHETVEVEFVRASGRTQALIELSMSAVRLVDDNDLLAVRHLSPLVQGAA